MRNNLKDCEFLKKEDITGWHGDVFDHPSYKTTCELDGKEIIRYVVKKIMVEMTRQQRQA